MRNSWGTSGMPHCPKVRSQDGWNPFWIGFVWKFRVLSTSNHWSMLIMIISLIFNDIHRYTIQLYIYIYICPFYLLFIYLCIICFWLWSNPVGICHKKKWSKNLDQAIEATASWITPAAWRWWPFARPATQKILYKSIQHILLVEYIWGIYEGYYTNYYTILYYTILYYTILCYTILYYTILYYIIL